ncbi:Bypass of stop codon protein 6 [Spathaspora sp. JA1]|nr:Bypass of stop codon protein 6 [Spathaspora sp. JA1]
MDQTFTDNSFTDQITPSQSTSPTPFPPTKPVNPSFLNIRYQIEHEGELLTVDTTNWKTSTLLKCQIVSSYTIFTLFGLAEQTTGTIIPKLQTYYQINDLHTSFIFLCGVTGYLTMAVISNITHESFGIRGVATLGTTSMTLAYMIISVKPPFLIYLLCSFFNGIGFGCLDASLNSWMGNLVDSNQLMGILHGCYGLGSMISPTLITYLMEKKENAWSWNQYYMVLSLIGGVCIVFVILSFKYETPKKYRYIAKLRNKQAQESIEMDSIKDPVEVTEEEISSSLLEEEEETNLSANLGMVLQSKLVWILSIFLFIYVGAEVAFGAWLVTYLLRIKHWAYKPSAHMSTTFWSGLTIGRMVLGFVTAHYFTSELSANLTYTVFSFVGYALFWLFSFTNLNWILFVIVFVTGVVVGPIFPTTIIASVNILPPNFHIVGIGFICAFGGGGAAGIPFLTGLIAESSDGGLAILPLVVIVLFAILLLIWTLIIVQYSKSYKRNNL